MGSSVGYICDLVNRSANGRSPSSRFQKIIQACSACYQRARPITPIAIPHKNDLDLGKRLALRFADDLLPGSLDDVYDIFRHKGAYGRFKSLLENRGMLQQWYEFEEKSRKEALRQWCEESGIEIHG